MSVRTHKLIIGLVALCLGLIAINLSALKSPAPVLLNPHHSGEHLPFDPIERIDAPKDNKKVFAHYFLPYPLSVNNQPPDQSYYQQQYLNPAGEKGKFRNQGGLLRQRPLPRAPMPEFVDYKLEDLRQEVRLAKAIGIDGFALNIMTMEGRIWEQTLRLLQVAEELDFNILVMPDMNAIFKREPERFVEFIKEANQWNAAQRLQDGRLVIAPYLAENQSPTWWRDVKIQLRDQGVDIALWPVFHNLSKQLRRFETELGPEFNDLFYGVSDWGSRTPEGANYIKDEAKLAKTKNLKMMSPVSPQDVRPKSSVFTEAQNSETYRALWKSSIENDIQWVHLISWNDYSESTEIAPSTLTQYAFYDLSAYYIHWFKTGEPPIVRDVLYGFYRTQSWNDIPADPMLELMKPTGNAEPKDEVELLAFLSQPGTLQIELANKLHQYKARKGVTSFKVPLDYGQPKFRILRDEQIESHIYDTPAIEKPITVSNLIYQGVGSARVQPTESSSLLSWPWRDQDFDESMQLMQRNGKSVFSPLRDDGYYEYIDASTNNNSGMGFSFNRFEHNNRRLEIVFDIRIETIQLNEVNSVIQLQDMAFNKPVLELVIESESLDRLCLRLDNNASDAKGCPHTLISNQWYRISMVVETDHPELMALSLQLKDQTRQRRDLTLKPINIPTQTINSIRFLTQGKPNVQAKLAVDNLKVKIQ